MSQSRSISVNTSSDGNWNLQQGQVFLLASHSKMHIQWNRCSQGNWHTSLPSRISSLQITHSTPPPLTSTDGRATTDALDAPTCLPAFSPPPPPLLRKAPMNPRHRAATSMYGIRTAPQVAPVPERDNIVLEKWVQRMVRQWDGQVSRA